jgi:hypothetical protein
MIDRQSFDAFGADFAQISSSLFTRRLYFAGDTRVPVVTLLTGVSAAVAGVRDRVPAKKRHRHPV